MWSALKHDGPIQHNNENTRHTDTILGSFFTIKEFPETNLYLEDLEDLDFIFIYLFVNVLTYVWHIIFIHEEVILYCTLVSDYITRSTYVSKYGTIFLIKLSKIIIIYKKSNKPIAIMFVLVL